MTMDLSFTGHIQFVELYSDFMDSTYTNVAPTLSHSLYSSSKMLCKKRAYKLLNVEFFHKCTSSYLYVHHAEKR